MWHQLWDINAKPYRQQEATAGYAGQPTQRDGGKILSGYAR